VITGSPVVAPDAPAVIRVALNEDVT